MTTITIPDGNTISVTSFDNNSYLVQANTQLVIANGGIVSGLITVTGNPAGRGGGNLEVQSGGTALNTIVSSGGYTRVSGAALNTTISSGGNLEVDAGGSALTTVVSSAGNMYQASGGYVSGLTVSRGGQVQIGGTATAIVDNGGGDNVFSAGTAVGTVVVNGGSESVNAGGVASGTVVSGGNQFVAQGGTVVGANVLAGGQESVYGSASGTTVSSGGQESLGGTDTGTTVNSGGREYVQAFATALGWTCRVCTQAPGLRGLKDQDQHTGAASITEAGLRTAAALSSRMAPGGRALRADTARHGPWHPTRALRLV